MQLVMDIIVPVLWFVLLGGIIGLLLAVASRAFAVNVDEKVELIMEHLPGANCGGCGYSGCAALAEAISKGYMPPNACPAAEVEDVKKIAEVLGVAAEVSGRRRAQVMCSGTAEYAKKKYIYEGAPDCISATKMGGGDKLCPNGCIGLGTCVKSCQFGAIKIEGGVAAVDYTKCRGCGVCTLACPKKIISMIPFDSRHWVGCMSAEDGKATRTSCDVGCISCRICEKNCPSNAIVVNDHVASIDYAKCTGCDICISKCPRKIIWSVSTQKEQGLIITRIDNTEL